MSREQRDVRGLRRRDARYRLVFAVLYGIMLSGAAGAECSTGCSLGDSAGDAGTGNTAMGASSGDGGATHSTTSSPGGTGTGSNTAGPNGLFTYASGRNAPAGIAINGTSVFWVENGTFDFQTNAYGNDGAVLSAPLAGGTIVTLLGGQNFPVGLAVDATYLYWTNSSNVGGQGAVVALPLAAGQPLTIMSNLIEPLGIAAVGGTVFWTDYRAGAVYDANMTSQSAPETVATGYDGTSSVASDGSSVYWANSFDGTILALSLASSSAAVVTLAQGQAAPMSVVIDNDVLYWTNAGTSNNGGSVVAVGTSGSTPETLASSQDNPAGIAVDGSTIYWANQGDITSKGVVSPYTGSVVRVAKTGGTTTTIAAGQPDPTSIAVDAHSVYWTNIGAAGYNGATLRDGSVVMLPK